MRLETVFIPLLLLLIAFLLYRPLMRLYRKSRLSLTLGPHGGKPFIDSYRQSLFSKVPLIFELLALALLLFAAASPVRLSRQRVFLDRGSDIVFVLDLSPSMSAYLRSSSDMAIQDASPRGTRRFDYARALVHDFAHKHPNTSLALVGLGRRAAIVCPPTNDHSAFLGALDSVRIGDYGDGTALGLGIISSLFHLSASTAPMQSIVLLTDGENNAGEVHPLTAARMAREAGIALYVLGIGEEGPAYLDYEDPYTKERKKGTFISHYDESALAAIAREGGGLWFKAENAQDLEAAFDFIAERSLTLGRSRVEYSSLPLFRFPLLLGLILFISARFLQSLGERGRKR